MTNRRKIMMVDDDEAVIDFLQIKLGAQYDIVSTMSPENVVSLARRELPAVIVCDIDMPGMSGTEVSELLAEHPDTAAIPLIYLTGPALPRELEATGGMLGGKPAVSKTAPLAELVKKIEAVAAGND